MTIYALGKLSVPFDELKNERSAARAAREGKRPSRCDSLGGLTTNNTELLWGVLEKMWDQDPRLRPTVSVVQYEMQQGLPR
jgi:hypothetical protein